LVYVCGFGEWRGNSVIIVICLNFFWVNSKRVKLLFGFALGVRSLIKVSGLLLVSYMKMQRLAVGSF